MYVRTALDEMATQGDMLKVEEYLWHSFGNLDAQKLLS